MSDTPRAELVLEKSTTGVHFAKAVPARFLLGPQWHGHIAGIQRRIHAMRSEKIVEDIGISINAFGCLFDGERVNR